MSGIRAGAPGPSMQGAESCCFDLELDLKLRLCFYWEGKISFGGAWRGLIGPLWGSQENPSQRGSDTLLWEVSMVPASEIWGLSLEVSGSPRWCDFRHYTVQDPQQETIHILKELKCVPSRWPVTHQGGGFLPPYSMVGEGCIGPQRGSETVETFPG